MFSKIIIILVGIASVEMAALTVFNTSMRPWQAESAKSAKAASPARLPTRETPLTIKYADKKADIPVQTALLWTAGNAVIAEDSKYASPENFVNAQIGRAETTASPKLNLALIGAFLATASAETNRLPQDAALDIADGRAARFAPHLDGQALDLYKSQRVIAAALFQTELEVTLPVIFTKPKIELSDLNSIGIGELVATGKSDFTGSSAARITNIVVGSSQYNGVIVMPGEEFSFTDNLGPVDAAHGFKPELVIKTVNGATGTVPEFGGGLCQVSTTAFRAAFFAGLPITARRNHSFAVRYYEWIDDDLPRAVGLDATIYSGVQDMKFINDTPGAILIWTRVEGKRLYFDFYGTKDDREVIVDGPHPYDRRASGAVRSKVTRTVTKPGEMPVELVYDSRYIPPVQAVITVEYPKPPAPPPAEDNQTINPPNT